MSQSKDVLIHRIEYSRQLEAMIATLFGRANKIANFLQIILGASVVSSVAPLQVGFAVVCIAAFQIVWDPGAKSMAARAQSKRYQELGDDVVSLSDAELQKKYDLISKDDSAPIGALALPAQLATALRLELDDSQYPPPSWWNKFLAQLAGQAVQKRASGS